MSVSNQNTEGYRKRLLQRRRELLEVRDFGRDSANTVELDQAKVGRLSRMDALQGQAMSAETNRRRDIELQRIDAALRRIEENRFGICVNCDERISAGRLQSDPATPVCIDCAR